MPFCSWVSHFAPQHLFMASHVLSSHFPGLLWKASTFAESLIEPQAV